MRSPPGTQQAIKQAKKPVLPRATRKPDPIPHAGLGKARSGFTYGRQAPPSLRPSASSPNQLAQQPEPNPEAGENTVSEGARLWANCFLPSLRSTRLRRYGQSQGLRGTLEQVPPLQPRLPHVLPDVSPSNRGLEFSQNHDTELQNHRILQVTQNPSIPDWFWLEGT